VLLAISVDFEDTLSAGHVEAAIQRLDHAIRERYPIIRRLFIEVQSAEGHRRSMQASTDTPHGG